MVIGCLCCRRHKTVLAAGSLQTQTQSVCGMEIFMREYPRPQEIYRHFKGNLYQIVTLAIHSETREELVVYQALYGDYKVYARPLSMFMEEVDRQKYPDVLQKYRFEKVSAAEAAEKQPGQEEKGKPPVIPEAVMQGDREEKGTKPDPRPLPQDDEEFVLDPQVMEFLDADTYEERLNILASMRHRITDDMINTMAISVDLEIEDGEIEERYEELKNCLLTLERFECNRLR